MINADLHLKKDWLRVSTKRATRDGFGMGLLTLARKNEGVVVLTGDLAESTRVLEFGREYPERFFEVGVAEQNLMGIGAGMALSGMIPFITSYAVFSPGRNWEQLRVSVAYTKANVKIAGHHAGLITGEDGATHQALEDVALTTAIPGLTVVVPADYEQAIKATMAIGEIKGPAYIRLSRPATGEITTEKTPFRLGKAQIMRYGEKVTIVATGHMVYEALKAAQEVDGEVINLHTLKPLDTDSLVESARKTGRVVTLEDHQKIGGMGSLVAMALAEHYPVPMKLMGVDNRFGESGDPDMLLKKYNLTWEDVVETIKGWR